jgi:TPR repeat protein
LAQNDLGEKYRYGKGIAKDYSEALKWFRLSAGQGHSEAQLNLGAMYNNGQGVPQDFAEAVKWYRLAANQDHPWAQILLGEMYREGKGVLQDYKRAHMWLNLAARNNTIHDVAVIGRDRVAKNLDPKQLNLAQDMARRCLESKYQDC